MQEMVVFIASPGDLVDERNAVRQAVASVNSLFASKVALRLRVTGWEETQPSFGRPQAVINPLVEQCDVFIGLLYRKWGTPTGEYTSGFEEEYEQAASRARNGERPRISIFFKRVPDDQIEDAGPSLSRVLAFKRRLEDQHIALYRQFDSTSDFRDLVTHYLTSVIIDEWNPVENSSPDGTVAKPDATTTTPLTASSEPQIEDEARSQIATTLRNFYNLAERGNEVSEEELDSDRLLLFSMAAQPEMIAMPIHSLNRIYAKAHELVLSVMEYRLILWTIADNIRREKDGTLHSIAPGFKIVAPPSGEYTSDLVDTLTYQILNPSADFSVVTGSFYILAEMKARPLELWESDEHGVAEANLAGGSLAVVGEAPVDKWVHILESLQVENAALEYIAVVVRDSDADLLGAVIERLDNKAVSFKLRALVEHAKGDLSGLAEMAATRYVSEGSCFEHLLLSSIPRMTTEQLASVLLGRALPDRVIHNALDLVSQRRVPSAEEFSRVLNSGSDHLIAFAFDAAERCDATRNLLAAVSELKNENALSNFAPRLKSLTATEEELSAELLSPPSFVAAWSALSWRRGAGMADEAREILDSDCANSLDAEKLVELGYDDDLTEFLKSKLKAAAVDLLARVPASDKRELDLVRFREELARNDWLSAAPAARALARLGTSQDVDTLLARAAKSYGDEKEEMLRGAARAGGVDTARKMAHDKDGEVALIGAKELACNQSISLGELQQLLYSSHQEVRMVVWESVALRMGRDELEAFLDKYRERDEGYYYDVVAAIDMALYLPR
ncbi:DUF4062 domain-containing protein [Streptomyces sp. HUAS TT20]|uniref:DUF4062 domain-containing protein n=1 Tax=Streptomyces sp. HUAS TT20 TaxID=3447509 RepID=UPI0021D87C87|nr:DUF4062 domain-containing protein [Streptomyces sp. HUAS 15-9]UXY32750.1 DUF4062 domain-containing protein [Streptomyces sp. HUAS 15-9]